MPASERDPWLLHRGLLAAIVLLLLMPVPGAGASLRGEVAGFRSFLYVSDQRIVTLEVVDSTSAIVNYISLGGTFELLRAPRFLVVDTRGLAWRGHVLVDEDASDPLERYRVSVLVKPGEFVGWELRGDFRSPVDFNLAAIDLGGRILELEGVTSDDFELLAARIGELNLDIADRELAIRQAGFDRGFGALHPPETERNDELMALFPTASQLPPVILTNPPPRLPSRFAGLADPVVVRVRAGVSKAGQVGQLEVVEGVNEELDEMAVATVRNSWTFLPAISDNETAHSSVVVAVVFAR